MTEVPVTPRIRCDNCGETVEKEVQGAHSELTNIEMSKRLRWADALKGAKEFDLAEAVFPDAPAFEQEAEELAA